MNAERLLERFLRYVKVDTSARDGATTYPSSTGQLELGAMLADELRKMGLRDVEHDEHGIVLATVPANGSHRVPVVALNSHLDTSPETSGKDVRPQVIRGYAGGDIPLAASNDLVIRVAENPELQQLVGTTLITTDGTTSVPTVGRIGNPSYKR
jgi:tripeptide aminopeptidase